MASPTQVPCMVCGSGSVPPHATLPGSGLSPLRPPWRSGGCGCAPPSMYGSGSVPPPPTATFQGSGPVPPSADIEVRRVRVHPLLAMWERIRPPTQLPSQGAGPSPQQPTSKCGGCACAPPPFAVWERVRPPCSHRRSAEAADPLCGCPLLLAFAYQRCNVVVRKCSYKSNVRLQKSTMPILVP